MRTLVDAAILEHSKVSSWKRRVLHHEEMHANPQNFQKWLFSDWLLVHAAVYGICCCQWTFDFVYFEQLRYGLTPLPLPQSFFFFDNTGKLLWKWNSSIAHPLDAKPFPGTTWNQGWIQSELGPHSNKNGSLVNPSKTVQLQL